MRYADTSAIVAAYLADEPDHDRWRPQILEASDPVITSELTRIEVASAFAAAARDRRGTAARSLIARFEADRAPGGPIQLLAFQAGPVLTRAVQLVGQHPLYAMDALHLAVALEQAVPLAAGEPLAFLTADRRQEAAARQLGFADPDDPSFIEATARLVERGEEAFLAPGDPHLEGLDHDE